MRAIGSLLLVVTLTAARAHAVIGHEGPFPLPGLSDAEEAAFEAAGSLFLQKFYVENGLGPVFNQNTCYSCHRRPTIGGMTQGRLVTRFGFNDGQTYDPLTDEGGPVQQGKGISQTCLPETLPGDANVISKRRTPSLFGAGLIEAIPDQQIIDRAAAEAAENPVRAGHINMVTGLSDGLPHVGRFGWKCQVGLILDFIGAAMKDEIGITNDLFPTENAPNGNPALLAQCDTVPDPEDTGGFLYKIYDMLKFMNYPPPPHAPNDAIIRGEQVFNQIGCAYCHYSGYTAVSSHPVLDGKPVPLFSDLLLHDIGTGDGIVQGDAGGNEFRTAPLWLVKKARPYLHDERGVTLTVTIDMHHGQAEDVRAAYYALLPADQRALQQFLKAR